MARSIWHPACEDGGGKARYTTFVPSLINPEPTASMNKLTLKGNWNITKGNLKQRYASLTDDDLAYVAGKEDELYGRIQKRTGETREQIERAIAGDAARSS